MDLDKCSLPSMKQTWAVFLAIVFPVHFWALIYYLRELPSYLLRMPIWDILGVLAYSQVIALLDSLILLLLVIGLALVLPNGWLKDQFSLRASLLCFAVILIVIPIHIRDLLPQDLSFFTKNIWIWIWACLLLAGSLALMVIAKRNIKFEEAILLVLEKIKLVSTFYLGIGLSGLLIVIIRNLVLR